MALNDAVEFKPSANERQLRIVSGLGREQLLVERVEAVEELGKPFWFTLDIISTLGEVDFTDDVGTGVGVEFAGNEAQLSRFFHGIITEVTFLRETKAGSRYRLMCRPWTYFLENNRAFRIHEKVPTREILQRRLGSVGLGTFSLEKCARGTDLRTYCVQYDESDWAFVSRLMEEEGIYYFFEHSKNAHKLIFCDSPQSHSAAKPASLEYNFDSDSIISGRTSDVGHFAAHWIERLKANGISKVKMNDWSFKGGGQMNVEKPTKGKFGKEVLPYVAPGNYLVDDAVKGVGKLSDKIAEAAMESLNCDRHVHTALSQSQSLAVGTKVKLEKHPKYSGEYLITGTRHVLIAERFRSENGGEPEPENAGEGAGRVNLTMIPATTPFRSPITTPRPQTRGLETAIVVGDGEIDTDEWGRVRVKFNWEPAQGSDSNSCWMRVSQTGGLGNIILPRVGHEVLVDFLGGNPDRPVVVGRVFNENHMPTYSLPANKTVALWRTKSVGSPGSISPAKEVGGDSGKDAKDAKGPEANEIRFEDKAGSEEIYIHANRDLNTRVRHKETHKVGLDQLIEIGQDRTELVERNEKITINGKQDITIKENQTETITQGNRKITLDKGNDELTVSLGDMTIKASAGNITIDGMKSITLKCVASTIKMTPASIEIKSPQIKVEGVGTVDVNSPLTTVKGAGMLTLKGAITMIN